MKSSAASFIPLGLIIFGFLVWYALSSKNSYNEERLKSQIKKYNDLETFSNNLKQQEQNLVHKKNETAASIAKQKEDAIKDKALHQKALDQKTIGFPWIATAIADLKREQAEHTAFLLRNKPRPAIKAAEKVQEIGKKHKIAEQQLRQYKYQIEFYESLFPWITDFKEAPDEVIQNTPASQSTDPATKFLTSSEWTTLDKQTKFQYALDRYWNRHKSNWEIGRDYERFVGYRYETCGYNVSYYGATEGLKDMGRDLIAQKNGKTEVIQCKYWSRKKTIHEKHIFQLFGTTIQYTLDKFGQDLSISNNLFEQFNVEPVFITSTTLSDVAMQVAKALNVRIVCDTSLEKYPSIKCNISKSKEKIYHLPFDQQYDRIRITPSTGEGYVATIAEAEAAGFRRAYRWKGNT
ncbi:MAG: restriction endonuclease [Desulfovibrio sp.]